jgi:hypothetical protein
MRFSNNNSSWSDWEMYGPTKAWYLSILGGDGSKTVFVQFRDGAGNASGSFVDSIILDTTPPVSTISSMPGPFYPAADGTFTFTATEIATFQCRMDSGSWLACSSPFNFSGFSDGSHTFSVIATDLAGNAEVTAKSYTFNIDTSAPDTTIIGNPPLLTNSPSGMFNFSSPDVVAMYQCKLDEGAWGHCFSSFTFNGLADGIHLFSVKAIDRSGNIDLTPATYTWRIDTTPPETAITGRAFNATNINVSILLNSNDPAARFECSLDGSVFAACTDPIAYAGLATGSHTFQVRAVDQAGNVDPTPAATNWITGSNVQLVGGSSYATMDMALAYAQEGSTIRAKAMSLPEDILFNSSKSITFIGGYGSNFESPTPGSMTIVNSLTIVSGSMTVSNLLIR